MQGAGQMPAAGESLGRYIIERQLGAGGMGVVYLARDTKLEREVAIKLLTPGLLRDADARARFHREALALARLNHAHIAAVYDVSERDGMDFLVMEYVPGETLAERIGRGPLTVAESTSIALGIAQALEDAHDKDIIHRDLKPANVVVTPRGQVKVLDFGLAKLLARSSDETRDALDATQGIAGTPAYMSPEQAAGAALDERTDLWSLGCVYYECLTGNAAFRRGSAMATLRAIADDEPQSVRAVRPEVPREAAEIVDRLLQKDPAKRYASAQQAAAALEEFSAKLSTPNLASVEEVKRSRTVAYIAVAALLVCVVAGAWLWIRLTRARWAKEEAPAQVTQMFAAHKTIEGLRLLQIALQYAPADAQLKQMLTEDSRVVDVTTEPAGARVSMQDYELPDGAWLPLGTTPLKKIRIPKGYFRWKVEAPGMAPFISAPEAEGEISFNLNEIRSAPPGMVPVNYGGPWSEFIYFVDWIGPYNFPLYYVDKFEVTNRDYQKFVDAGGYIKPEFWREKFVRDGHELQFAEAIALFRDARGRAGPAGWEGGHFPAGQDDFPVTGVSWFEASAYATWAGKQLPVMPQWYQTVDPGNAHQTVAESNFSGKPAPVGQYPGVGSYGTYDMAGNAREWAATTADNNLRFILGGSWSAEPYLYSYGEAVSPFDRSANNGFRCVKNTAPLPAKSLAPVHRFIRDFATAKPLPDEVFRAYMANYRYASGLPLNATEPQTIKETPDWIKQKVTIDTAYNGERMAIYIFLPKHAKPPYQTVLFYPSARVLFLDDSSHLGDQQFFDYVVQSGRAVVYPVYEDMYERRNAKAFPTGGSELALLGNITKDAGRALDYIATRHDLDSSRLGYLGVSAGSAQGVFVVEEEQQRLKTAIFLDGGYFLDPPLAGADQVDFVTRIHIPVLMINGRYDFTFPLEQSQQPFFNMMGTPPADKQHVVLDTPHDVTQDRPRLVQSVLGWLDKYLGPVQ